MQRRPVMSSSVGLMVTPQRSLPTRRTPELSLCSAPALRPPPEDAEPTTRGCTLL